MASSSSSSPPALDAARVADLRALGGSDMPGLADEVAQIFVRVAREGMARLLDAARDGSCAAVAHEAHRLKGSCGNIGAVVLERLCDALEIQAREGVVASMPEVRAAALELERVLEAMAEEFDLGD